MDFRQADIENFVRELQAIQRESNIQAVRPPDSCCATLVAGSPLRYAWPPSFSLTPESSFEKHTPLDRAPQHQQSARGLARKLGRCASGHRLRDLDCERF